MTATIVVPMLPPHECSPNWHGHWATKAAAVKELRDTAGWYTRYCQMTYGPHWPAFSGVVVMDVVIAWSGRRKPMDDDNAWASLKACRDGIADILFDGEDRLITQGTLRQTRGDGTISITLREAE
jgi:hypothetical protein